MSKNKKIEVDLRTKYIDMHDRYDAKSSECSLRRISKLYKKTRLDPAFQRYGGVDHGSGWNFAQGRHYVSNCLKGSVFNNILSADVAACKRHAEDEGDAMSSRYFSECLDMGYELVSIDGWNSQSYINAFLNDHKEVYVADTHGNKVYFGDLDEDQQDIVANDRVVRHITLRKISLNQMCDLFRDLNEQEKLRNQEHRGARISRLSTFIRESANHTDTKAPSVRDMFKTLVYNSDNDLDKRSHEEMVALLSFKIYSKYAIAVQKKSLDGMYENMTSLSADVESRVDYILKECAAVASTCPGPLKEKLTKGGLQNLWDAIDIVKLRSYKITDHEAFLRWFIDLHTTAMAKSGTVPDDDKENLSYRHWTAYHNRFYNQVRQMISDKLNNDLPRLLESSVLQKKRTPQERFNFNDKVILWDLQGHLDRNDMEIEAIDLYLGRTHADHVRSVRDGGATTLENGELMFAEDNLKKGSNSNLPAFPHQEDFAFEEDEE